MLPQRTLNTLSRARCVALGVASSVACGLVACADIPAHELPLSDVASVAAPSAALSGWSDPLRPPPAEPARVLPPEFSMPREPRRPALVNGAVNRALARHMRVGKGYEVSGVRYQPRHDPDYDHQGRASWYGDRFHGRRTASGEAFDMHAFTAAHTTLPFGSLVEVENLRNGRAVVVRINDRGPFAEEPRLIDLSKRAAAELGFLNSRFRPKVRVRYLGPSQPPGERAGARGTVSGTVGRVDLAD